jgi:GNAT superfamily N-acetyltransferase
MEVVRPADASAFLRIAGPLLEHDGARHNLILGIAGSMRRHPEAFGVVHLWVAVDEGRPVAAALQTEPHHLILGDPATDSALDAVLDAVHEDGVPFPGLMANVPFAEAAGRRWAERTGRTWETSIREGVWRLTRVREIARPAGAARPASAGDRELLVEWNRDFLIEALPEPEEDLPHVEERVDRALTQDDAGTWLWETEGAPVALSSYWGPTPTGIRVGPVYTPPAHRRRGYATALVADLSAHLLAAGHGACYLSTDLANPTSNSIYARIGYERICDSARIRFRPP